MTKVSVIIPIYGVADYIGRCAESLMQQTMRDGVEFIFVNDATPDRSMEVLSEVVGKHPERASQVRVLTHSENRGLPAARNTGLAAAQGEYVFHCDSDDYLEPDALETLYAAATEHGADLVWCDWWLTYDNSERHMTQPGYATSLEAVKAMLGGRMKYNVWNKLARRSLYTENSISFPEDHGMGEDMTMMMLTACARKVAHVPHACYHYRRGNEQAFTSAMSDGKLADVRYNVERTTDFLLRKYGSDIADTLNFFKLNVKFPWLISADRRMYAMWRATFPEADAAIGSNPYMPLRNKLLQHAAHCKCDALVKFYYLIFYKVLYSILYR